jgi:hypothetical protein
MPDDELVEYMGRIASGVAEYLEPRGFGKQQFIFNKWTPDGLCYVVDLQMGIKSLEGEFTANLGIFVPEVFRSMSETEQPEFVSVGYCSINARFSDFTDDDDKWWPVTPYPAEVVPELIDLLQTYGLPMFIKFPDRQSLIDGLLPFAEKYGVAMRPELDIVLMLEHTGKHDEAQQMFTIHYRESRGRKEYARYLEKLAVKQNWDIDR